MNANETVKALKICGNGKVACCGCPYYIERDASECRFMLIHDAAEIITEQAGEIQQLQAQAARMREAVEVLETVTEHLENCYGRNTPDTEKAREALAAIDKIGGREDV